MKKEIKETKSTNYQGTSHKEFCKLCIAKNLVCPNTKSGELDVKCNI